MLPFFGGFESSTPKKNETVWEKKSHGSTSGDRSVNGMMIFFADPRDSKGGGFLGFGIATFRGVFDHIFRSDPTHVIPWKMGPWTIFTNSLCLYVSEFLSNLWGLKGGSVGAHLPRGPVCKIH